MDNKGLGADPALVQAPGLASRPGPSGFDQGDEGFPRERLLYAATSIAALASKKAREVAYGAWNPLNMGSDAADEAADFLEDMRAIIAHYERHVAIAMETRSATTAGRGPQDDSAAIAQNPADGSDVS